MEFPHGHVGRHHHESHRNNRGDDDDNNPNYPHPPPPFSVGGGPMYPPQQPPSFGSSYNRPPPSYGGDFNEPRPSIGGGYDAPPPSYGGGGYNAPPPSYGGGGYNAPPPHQESQNYPPPHAESHKYPPPSSYGHQTSSHYGSEEVGGGVHHSGYKPHMPAFMEGHFHHGSSGDHNGTSNEYGHSEGGPGAGPEMGLFEGKTSYKMECKSSGDRFVVAVRDGKLVLTHPNPSDHSQHWYKDESFSIKVKDKEGHPSFILVNKATGQAVKHSVSGHPVQLVPYKQGVLDESIMWTESKDLGSRYRTIRMVNNVKLVMDAFNGDENHGGVHDGTYLALFECWRGDNRNQQWKLVPY